MSDSAGRLHELHPSAVETAFAWFLRIVAAYCLLFGMLYWVRLIGVYDGPMWRYDLMPVHWQIASVMLAVFFPFAAIGLWMLSSWGPVIWFICAVTEIVMYGVLPDLFGSRPLIVATNIAVALIYAGFRIVLHLQRRRAAQ
ncbi:DUF6163 family protein [Aminobacter sp. HY435]|uniref:DUF6163 family protein n=1 Tax=Aminobacter sp. HY435 TaxID=2970917 RepID=UPI0022B9AD4D|nr:DUF6163 family protein [Aminobacter sp. HY435]